MNDPVLTSPRDFSFHAQADILLRVLRSYELKGDPECPEVDAALNELEERVVLLREILAKEAAEARLSDDSADDVPPEPDDSEMQDAAVESATKPGREERVAEAAKKIVVEQIEVADEGAGKDIVKRDEDAAAT
jgi:hypothetical protein